MLSEVEVSNPIIEPNSNPMTEVAYHEGIKIPIFVEITQNNLSSLFYNAYDLIASCKRSCPIVEPNFGFPHVTHKRI